MLGKLDKLPKPTILRPVMPPALPRPEETGKLAMRVVLCCSFWTAGEPVTARRKAAPTLSLDLKRPVRPLKLPCCCCWGFIAVRWPKTSSWAGATLEVATVVDVVLVSSTACSSPAFTSSVLNVWGWRRISTVCEGDQTVASSRSVTALNGSSVGVVAGLLSSGPTASAASSISFVSDSGASQVVAVASSVVMSWVHSVGAVSCTSATGIERTLDTTTST